MRPDVDFRRIYERKQYNSSIRFAHKERGYSGIIKNISLGGAFIAINNVNLFEINDIISISIPFTNGKEHVKRRGRIKWMNNEGFAIEFI
jgi:hypothetical protein